MHHEFGPLKAAHAQTVTTHASNMCMPRCMLVNSTDIRMPELYKTKTVVY